MNNPNHSTPSMKTMMLVPQAPLVFRSGRPFLAGSRDEVQFPWPSSVAGVVRSTWMDQQHWPVPLSAEQETQLKQRAVHGPILALRAWSPAEPTRTTLTPLLPKPADAVLLLDEQTNTKHHYRLVPSGFEGRAGADMPLGLQPLQLENCTIKGKPQRGAEHWTWTDALAWSRGEAVAAPQNDDDAPSTGPERVTRTHVAIDPSTNAGRDGALFQTEGWDCAPRRDKNGRGWANADHVLLCRGPASSLDVQDDWVCWGGERRLSRLQAMPASDASVLELPADHAKAVLNQMQRHHAYGRLRLTLVTPALFDPGWYPAWINPRTLCGEHPSVPGLQLRLKAAAVERWQGLSGWDLARKQPRATRKAVAAGATYWFELCAPPPDDWLACAWLASVSDQPQDRRDGFGLGLWGCW